MKKPNFFAALFGLLLSISVSVFAFDDHGLRSFATKTGDTVWTLNTLVCGDANWRGGLYDANVDLLPAPIGAPGSEKIIFDTHKVPKLRIPAWCEPSHGFTRPITEPTNTWHGDEIADEDVGESHVDSAGRVNLNDEVARLQAEIDSWSRNYNALRKDRDELAAYPQWLGSAFFALLFLAATGLLLAWFLSTREHARLRAMQEEEAIRARDHERAIALLQAQREVSHVIVAIAYNEEGRPTSYDARGPGAQVPTNWYGLDGKPIMVVHRPDNSE